ncbi:hypothetical protein AKJ45_00335 [candidate division MSBL1 archaeon SCGC-AAA261F19]|uniref:PIN domain-containing protein n=1 Tax=candidate division MSBL1 archaeon SCGC-AAA261F19 TaxID=1698275 RepID=A0A133VBM0_9EURY|nr:hypothetical protein AKJ45_00335 [candidate division MSBL1 archaeon SCGC-AAA261F19]
MKLPDEILIEADMFISYLTGDELEPKFSEIVKKAEAKKTKIFSSSEVYDDIISALRSQEVELEKVLSFVSDMRAIPHESIPMTVETARIALNLYRQHKGSRKLHYFDSFHVATAHQETLPLLTSDQYILEHAGSLDIQTINPRKL